MIIINGGFCTGVGRYERDEWHDVHAGQPTRLRRLGQDGQPGLELPGSVTVLPQVRGQPPGDHYGRRFPRSRWSTAGRTVPVPPSVVARHLAGRSGARLPGARFERGSAHRFCDRADHVQERFTVQLCSCVPATS